MKLAMVIDSSRCINCKACTLACKTANSVPTGEWRNWIKTALPANPEQSTSSGYPSRGDFQPGACMHCQNATCVDACPTGATSRNKETNEVTINKVLCIGCGSCLRACPYDARYLPPELHVADKCDYCVSRRDQNIPPACANTCPTHARVFGDLDDPASEASQRLAAFPTRVYVQNSQTPTNPNMVYVKGTAPTDWPRPAEKYTSITLMKSVAKPILQIATGVVGLGVVGAFVRSLVLPDKEEDDHNSSPKGDENNE